jgi:hypothetical protein
MGGRAAINDDVETVSAFTAACGVGSAAEGVPAGFG